MLPSIVLSFAFHPLLSLRAIAVPVSASISSAEIRDNRLQNIFVPPNSDTPERTQGAAARRPSCFPTEGTVEAGTVSPVALLPKSNHGLTLKAHPVFLIYLPTMPEETHSVFFHIRDDKGENVYGTFLSTERSTTPSSNVVRVEMPADAPDLEIGTLYRWSVAIPCAGDLRPDTPYVSGWVERVEDSAIASYVGEPTSAPSLEEAWQYGQSGIWYDMIAALDELQRLRPTDTETTHTWRSVLQLVGIDAVNPL